MRQGRVYKEIEPDCVQDAYPGCHSWPRQPGSIIHSDGWRSYNGLVDLVYQKHFGSIMAKTNSSMNDVILPVSKVSEAMRKALLAGFRSLSKAICYWHLMYYELRFNHRGQDIYKVLLKIVRARPLFKS